MGTVNVEKLNYPYCQKVLPLVYDDSLSYYENICQFINKLNEMAEAINTIETNILAEAKAYTDEKVAESLAEVDEKIAELKVLINDTKTEFEALLNQVQAQYDEFVKVVDARIVFINNKIDDLNALLVAGLKSANAYTDTAIANNNVYLMEEISKGLIDLKVLNYFTGEYVTVQAMFDYLAQFHLQNAITYQQIVAKDKTYNEIAAYNATYTELAVNGFNIIV